MEFTPIPIDGIIGNQQAANDAAARQQAAEEKRLAAIAAQKARQNQKNMDAIHGGGRRPAASSYLPKPKVVTPAGPAPEDPFVTESKRIAAAQTAYGQQKVSGTDKTFEQMLADQMTGKAPSVADAQMRAAFDRSIAAQQGAVASARGINPGLAQRLIARQAGVQQAELGQQAGIAKMQEQQQAVGASQADTESRNAMARFFEAQRTGNFQAMKNAELEIAAAKARANAARQQRETNILGGLIQAGATIVGAAYGAPVAGAVAGQVVSGAVAGGGGGGQVQQRN